MVWHRYLLKSILCLMVIFGCVACQNTAIKKEASIPKTDKVILKVPMIKQEPELANGCEVTSLAMLLRYAGVQVDKMTLADEIRKDETPIEYGEEGHIVSWGNPHLGFVGDITFNEHAVLLTGYDKTHGYIHNPLTGEKYQVINKEQLIKVWNEMGNMAVSYR
ncbi:MAG: C39 family peptidase [Cellulosilyticum sp.]|nr:C39 family peptidase [Cellulosilyticum sp.]